MPFGRIKTNNMIMTASLQIYRSLIPIKDIIITKQQSFRRVSFPGSLYKCREKSPVHLKGTMTVEAAVVLPLFIFAMVTILYCSEVMRYSNTVASALHQVANDMSVKAYVTKAAGDQDLGSIGGALTGVALSETYVSSKVSNELNKAGIKQGNISYLRSKIMDNDIIDLVAAEEISMPFDLFGIGKFRLLDRARVHAYTGYDNSRSEGMDANEEVVYITESGSVYHSSRNCSHLKVTVKQVSPSAIAGARNSSQGKYYPCEYCHPKADTGPCYITDYGDRYHCKANCQALKRDIISVPISQVGGRGPCKDCN